MAMLSHRRTVRQTVDAQEGEMAKVKHTGGELAQDCVLPTAEGTERQECDQTEAKLCLA